MPIRSVALVALTLLAGCSGLSREDRIADRLEQAGLKPALARCMAGKLAIDLDDDELRRLADAAKPREPDGSRPGRKALLRRVDDLGDPHVSSVVARAGIGCTILG